MNLSLNRLRRTCRARSPHQVEIETDSGSADPYSDDMYSFPSLEVILTYLLTYGVATGVFFVILRELHGRPLKWPRRIVYGVVSLVLPYVLWWLALRVAFVVFGV